MSSDVIGEYYCLSELLLAGKEAYLANGLTQKGWDIAVLDGNETIRVQVKCINWEASGQAAVKGTFISRELDFLSKGDGGVYGFNHLIFHIRLPR